jgi:cytochrome c oxidase subunit 2
MRSRLFLTLVVSIVAVSLIAVACGGGEETVVPTVTPSFTPAPTTPPAVAQPTQAPAGEPTGASLEEGKAAFVASICITCHKVEGTAAVGVVGPDLTHIGALAGDRVAGMTAEAYIRESIEDPAAFIVDGFDPLMPPGMNAIPPISDNYDAVVAYMLSLK